MFVFFLLATTSATLGAITALIQPEEPEFVSKILDSDNLGPLWRKGFQYKLSEEIQILVMGIDYVPGASPDSRKIFQGRSDTMLLLRLAPEENSVNLLSIPRDTLVTIPGVGRTRINEANVVGGVSLVTEILGETLNKVEVHRYVRVSKGAFRELVDLLGGVEVFVPRNMSYTDNTQKLKIELAAGWQTLDGERAEHFARFREETYGDIGRIQRQQLLLTALRNRITSPAVLPRLPGIVRVMQKYVDTNLSFEEMLALVSFGLQLEPEQLKMVMLPGRPSEENEYYASYWVVDEEGRDRVMYQYFQIDSTGFNYDSSKVPSAYSLLPHEVTIAVQNASGDSTLGEKAIAYLRDKGYYNAYLVPNWPDREHHTTVIVQGGDLQAGETLTKTLGFARLESASIGEIGSDLTIRLGEDSLGAFQF
jgi:LCP family protein required for cell wall assembly